MLKVGRERDASYLDRRLLFLLALFVAIAFTLSWHIGAAPASPAEKASISVSKTLHLIRTSPIDAPYRILEYGLIHFNHSQISSLRLVSVFYYLVFLGCFYLIARWWFGGFGAKLGAILLGATPLVMLMARSASGDIMYLFPLCVIATYMWFVRSKSHLNYKLLLLCLLTAAAFYQPAGAIFAIAGIIYIRGTLAQTAKAFPKKIVALGLALFVLVIAPLVWAVATDTQLLKPLLLWPATLPGPLDFIKWLGWSFLALIWHSGQHNYLQVGKAAVLDATQVVLVFFGVYVLRQRALNRTYALAASVAFAILEAAFNQNYNLLVFSLPALAIFATAGIRYLHIEWNSIFPRNPLPRGLALTLILAVIGVHIFWGVHYSLIAWPHSFALTP